MTEEEEAVPPAILEMNALMGAYFSEESRIRGYRFKPTPEDVIFSTGAKSGTTWLQQICHGLRSGGDMSFDEISLVIPCLEMAYDYGYTDLESPQPYLPRMYKTHFWYRDTPKGAGKYIVVVRNPEDAALSFYYFLKDWFFRGEDISPDEFVNWFYLKRGAPEDFLTNSSQIHHIVSWYPHRLDANVLWLHFEDLKEDTRACVRLIADFLEIGKGDDALQELVTRQAHKDFMKKNFTKFDEHPLKLEQRTKLKISLEQVLHQNTGKIREGKANGAKQTLSTDTLAMIRKKWRDVAGAETGFDSYDAFREAINRELDRPSGKRQE